ncbi:hypothetical protein CVT25_003023 [Psilocybe cyanescens]|uniref:Flavin reductase like domain-containing protein n=1 Tax=Psilocybe cyanescens TaxID=93625 RepID=A0A409WN77_PSICY|nr:hypothetical protein CVT25_003023 [Psilocybe cyanescens]
MSCRFKLKLHAPNAVTRPGFARQGQLEWSRLNSTGRPFDFQSTFKLASPSAPTWCLGDGLSHNSELWQKEILDSKRKSWDFTKSLADSEGRRDSYRILTSAIIPRPIALVSTLSEDGVPNLAPFRLSRRVLVSHNPPLVSLSFSLSPRRPKDTRNNILATREFTISIISEAFAEAANSTSVESPANTNEWLISGLTKEDSTTVKPPFVRESAVGMECELYNFQDIGLPGSVEHTVTVILGLIKKMHVREAVLNEDGITVDPAKLRPIARLGRTTYGRLLEGFDLPRLSWKAIRDEYPKLPRP